MSFPRPTLAPRVAAIPAMPVGETIASYPSYADAQKAIAYLVEQRFPVEQTAIVGTNLHSVERVTGRLSYGRVAIAGAMSGAWFGLFVGLLMSFGGQGFLNIGMLSVGVGAGFGLLFSVFSYSITRRRRDFTSNSQIVATQYAILCQPATAGEARRLLGSSVVGVGRKNMGVKPTPVFGSTHSESEVVRPYVHQTSSGVYLAPKALAPTSDSAAVAADSTGATLAPTRKVDSRWTTADGLPKYGAMADGADLNSAANVPPIINAVVVPEPKLRNASSSSDADPFAPPPKK
jgi:hypothetical protein